MGQLAAVQPDQPDTVRAIYQQWENVNDSQRFYLGASIIGAECDRYLWYNFRHCTSKNFNGRMRRLLNRGDREEEVFADELRSIGCTVYTVDPDTDKQFEFEALGGHVKCHLDGAVLGVPEAPRTWHLTEFKTHSEKSFKDLQKNGVQKAKPTHYAQCMMGMKLAGLARALYMAVNKNTDELYTERIRYDANEANQLLERAERIIFASTAPPRVANRPDDFRCKWCEAADICWGHDDKRPALPLPLISCRQCCHATPRKDGGWQCEKLSASLTNAAQLQACLHHLLIPDIVWWADPIDTWRDDQYELVKYQNHDDAQGATCWLQGSGAYPTSSLMVVPYTFVYGAADKQQNMEDLLLHYPPEDSEMLWEGPVDDIAGTWQEMFNTDIETLTPIRTCDYPTYTAAEYEGSMAVCMDKRTNQAVILRGKE